MVWSCAVSRVVSQFVVSQGHVPIPQLQNRSPEMCAHQKPANRVVEACSHRVERSSTSKMDLDLNEVNNLVCEAPCCKREPVEESAVNSEEHLETGKSEEVAFLPFERLDQFIKALKPSSKLRPPLYAYARQARRRLRPRTEF